MSFVDLLREMVATITDREKLGAALRDETEMAPYIHMAMMLSITAVVAAVFGLLLPSQG